jgi:stage II sporulation protein AA (anti-sigma F factor antagonist)
MNNCEKIGDTVIIYLPEEVDDYNAGIMIEATEEVFRDTRVKNVVFDFEKTHMMDSSGIGLITRRFRNVYDRGGQAFVSNVGERLDKLLTMSGIYRIATKL